MKRNSSNSLISRISKDFLLNILASILSTGIMQLIVYPRLAIELSADEYGIMLTIMGYVSVITLAFGNNLCNSRILQEHIYEENGMKGDFQILVTLMAVLSSIAISICCIKIDISNAILTSIIFMTLVTILKSYYLVVYRIKIDYKKNLLANLFIGLGYVVGALIVIKFMSWPWVFTCGCLFGLCYIWKSTKIMREPFVKTELFGKSSKIVFILAFSGLISNVTTYLDRFMIYPLLGSKMVSVYATAAFFSKSLNLVLAPITTVFLSYLTSKKIVLDQKKYLFLNCGIIVLGMLFWTVAFSVGKNITGYLYPTLIEDAADFIPYASLGITIGIVSSFSSIVVLAYAPVRWQTILPFIRIVLYLTTGYFLIIKRGLLGLCMGIIITNSLVFLITFVVGYFYVKRKMEVSSI